jgi:dihydroorotase
MYDLLLSGGTVIDPSQGLHAQLDVAVQSGRIAQLSPHIARESALTVIEVKDRLVTPGLIDLHAHVFDGVSSNGVDPDLAGVHAGVTTVVDAGSAGSATFQAFPRHVLPKSRTEVLPFMHICQTGLMTTPDIFAERSIDLDAT